MPILGNLHMKSGFRAAPFSLAALWYFWMRKWPKFTWCNPHATPNVCHFGVSSRNAIYIYYTHINTCRYLWENGDLWNFWCLFCSRKISHQNHGGLAGRGQMHRLTGDVNVVRAVFNLRSTCGRPSNASLEKKGLICWLWDLMSEILGKCSDLWHDARCLAGNSLTLADVFSHW